MSLSTRPSCLQWFLLFGSLSLSAFGYIVTRHPFLRMPLSRGDPSHGHCRFYPKGGCYKCTGLFASVVSRWTDDSGYDVVSPCCRLSLQAFSPNVLVQCHRYPSGVSLVGCELFCFTLFPSSCFFSDFHLWSGLSGIVPHDFCSSSLCDAVYVPSSVLSVLPGLSTWRALHACPPGCVLPIGQCFLIFH